MYSLEDISNISSLFNSLGIEMPRYKESGYNVLFHLYYWEQYES